MPAKSHSRRDDFRRAVVIAVCATFGEDDWIDLGIRTGSDDLIANHPRLIRSLRWGDPDYKTHARNVLEDILEDESNAAAVEEVVGLRAYLRANEPALYARLYRDDETMVAEVEAAAGAIGLDDVAKHVERIRAGLSKDPAQAIGSSKELLETVCKGILGLHGHGRETLIDLPKLNHQVQERLGLAVDDVSAKDPAAQQRRKMLGALTLIVQTSAELRNAGFGTGHGGSRRTELDVPTARLVVAAASALATYYLEVDGGRRADAPVLNPFRR